MAAFASRRARTDECAALSDLALRSKALWGYDAAFIAACVPELTVRPEPVRAGDVWVAEDGAGVAGFVAVDGEGRTLEVDLLYVEPERVRSGVGRALWGCAERLAVARAADVIVLDADPHAVCFYEAMGMTIVGQTPSGSIPGRMLPRMKKRVRDAASAR